MKFSFNKIYAKIAGPEVVKGLQWFPGPAQLFVICTECAELRYKDAECSTGMYKAFCQFEDLDCRSKKSVTPYVKE